MSFWQIVKREVNIMFRLQWKTAFFVIVFPVLYVLMFGGVYMTSIVQYIPTVIYDQDQSAVSRMLVQSFEDSEKYHIVGQTNSEEELNEYIKEKKAQVGIVIPPDFSKDVRKGISSTVLLITNGNNVLFANSVISSASEIVQTFSVGSGQKQIESIGQIPAEALAKTMPISFRTRILNNSTYGYSDFIMPGLAITSVQVGIILAICATLTSEFRKLKEWEGISTIKIVLGKLLPYWFFGTFSYVLCLFFLVFVFQVPLRGSFLVLMMNGTAFVFVIVAVGSIFSTIAPDEIWAMQLPALYIMPAFLYSGYSWPQFAMNDISLAINSILPLSYAADNIRDIMLSGYAPLIYRDTGILLVAGFVLLAISTLVFEFRRRRGGCILEKP